MTWITFENLYFLFLLAVTLHNLEEAVWLPDWSQQAGRWHRPVEKIPFRFAVLVLTLLAYVFAYLGLMGGKQSVGIYLLGGYVFVMLVNVFFPPFACGDLAQAVCPGLGYGSGLESSRLFRLSFRCSQGGLRFPLAAFDYGRHFRGRGPDSNTRAF